MTTLGLDPSLTNFGWCLIDDDGFSVLKRGRWQTPSKQIFIERYVYLREELRKLIQAEKPDRIGIESPIFNDLYSEGMYGLFLFCNDVFLVEKQDAVFFAPPQVKSHAFDFMGRPKGWKMKKADMVEASKKKSNTNVRWNHNEADAYWVGVIAHRFWEFYEGKILLDDLSEKEKHQFARKHTYTRGKKAGTTAATGLIYRKNDRFFIWSQKGETNA
tara:strand:- start:211 stop:858 length:648 start_codon:yes stop_codon:yes gene_type:complete